MGVVWCPQGLRDAAVGQEHPKICGLTGIAQRRSLIQRESWDSRTRARAHTHLHAHTQGEDSHGSGSLGEGCPIKGEAMGLG